MKKYNNVIDLNQEVMSLEEIILTGAAEHVRLALELERGNYLKAMERLKMPDGSPAIKTKGTE